MASGSPPCRRSEEFRAIITGAMPSERIQRRIDSLLDQCDEAVDAAHWSLLAERARAVLAIDEASEDALAFLKMAEANGTGAAAAALKPHSVRVT